MENTSLLTLQLHVSTCASVLQDLRPFWIIYFAISLNVVLGVTATLGNILILVALSQDSRQLPHLPTRLLFRSLALTDLCVGLISQPCFVIYLVSVVTKRFNICEGTEVIMQISSATLCSISLCTLTAISVDRLLALQLGLRYRQVVTIARVRGIIILSWLVFLSLGMLYFWNRRIFTTAVCGSVLLCLVASTSSYIKIYFTLRYRLAQLSQQNAQDQRNIFPQRHVSRYKRTVSSSLWIYFILIVSYLPFAVVQVVRTLHGDSPFIVVAEGITTSLVYLNSSLNPFIYCWRIREVRQAVKSTINRLGSFCC